MRVSFVLVINISPPKVPPRTNLICNTVKAILSMSFLSGRLSVSLDLPSDILPSDGNGGVSEVIEDFVWWTRIGLALVSLSSAGGLSPCIMLTPYVVISS